MKAFEMRDFSLQVDPNIWGLLPFKAILKRDKSRTKELAFKEMLFVYFYTDIRSDYVYIADDKERASEIVIAIGLPIDWKMDNIIKEAVAFYEERSITPIGKLYKSALKAAYDVSKYLESAEALLAERTNNGGMVTKISDITNALAKVPAIMRDLKAAYKEVVKEQIELEGKTKGSKTFGMFEDGL